MQLPMFVDISIVCFTNLEYNLITALLVCGRGGGGLNSDDPTLHGYLRDGNFDLGTVESEY